MKITIALLLSLMVLTDAYLHCDSLIPVGTSCDEITVELERQNNEEP
jgi:hypothetical protein